MTSGAAKPRQVDRLLFDRHPVPMWAFALETLRFWAVNQAAIRAYGHREVGFLALSLPDIRPATEVPVLMATLAESQPGPGWCWPRTSPPACERRYRDIAETAVKAIWTPDAQTLTRFVNPNRAQRLGAGTAEMMGRRLTDFMNVQGVDLANANLKQRSQGVSEQHDFRFCRQDGSGLWVAVSTHPVQDAAGASTAALATAELHPQRRAVLDRVEHGAGRRRHRPLQPLGGGEARHHRAQAGRGPRRRTRPGVVPDRRGCAAGAPLGEAREAIVLGLQASQPGLRANLMLLDALGTRLQRGAAPRLPEDVNRALDDLPVGPMVGSGGTAAFTGQRMVSAAVLADPRFAEGLPLMAADGIVSAWTEPILGPTGKVLGTLVPPPRPGAYARRA